MFDRWVYEMADAEKSVVYLRRVAESYGVDPNAAVQEATNLSQTTTLSFPHAVDEVIQRMGRGWDSK